MPNMGAALAASVSEERAAQPINYGKRLRGKIARPVSLPAFLGDFFAAKTFSGSRDGYVYGIRDGKLGYHRDIGPCDDAQQEAAAPSCDPALRYLWLPGVGWQGGTEASVVTLDLDALVPRSGPTELWQVGQRRRTRCPRNRVRKKRLRPAAGFDIGTACEADDNSFRAHGLVAIDTVNGNTGATMLMFLEKSAADAVVGQELRVAGAQALTLQRTA